MQVDITDEQNSVRVRVTDGENQASCVVIGRELSDVEDNVEEYIEIHSLEEDLEQS